MADTKIITALIGALALGAALLVPGPGLGTAEARTSQADSPLTVNTTDLAIGTDLTVSGTGCVGGGGSTADRLVRVGLADPDQPEQLELPFFDLGKTTVEADGSWTFATTVAQPLPPGRWLLVAGCFGVDQVLAFTYEPTEVTNTPPLVTGIVVDGDVLSIDNPCRDQTSMPPYDPEIIAGFRSPTTPTVFALEGLAPIPTGTARTSFRVPASVLSGTYLLEVDCLAHRVSEPLAIFATTIDWVAAPASATTTTTADGDPGPTPAAPTTTPGDPQPAPAIPASAVEGSATYTG